MIRYEVVPNFPDYKVGTDGSVWSKRQFGEWRKLHPGGDKYLAVSLSNDSGLKQYRVHVLILVVFVGPRPRGLQARHLDGDHMNNRLSNLKWGTAGENWSDKILHGRATRGETHPAHKLSDEIVLKARSLWASGETLAAISAALGIRCGLLHKAIIGGSWDHLPGAQKKRRHWKYNRLSPKTVKEIKAAISSGKPQAAIAREFGIGKPTVCCIASGKIYKT